MQRIGSSAYSQADIPLTKPGAEIGLKLVHLRALADPARGERVRDTCRGGLGNMRMKKHLVAKPGLHQGKLVHALFFRIIQCATL